MPVFRAFVAFDIPSVLVLLLQYVRTSPHSVVLGNNLDTRQHPNPQGRHRNPTSFQENSLLRIPLTARRRVPPHKLR